MRRLAGTLLVVALSMLPAVALADGPVGLSVTGRAGRDVQSALERGLAERGLRVVPVPEGEPAGGLGLRARVVGTARTRGRRVEVDLRVLDPEGAERQRIQATLARGRDAELVARLADALATLGGPGLVAEAPRGEEPTVIVPEPGPSARADAESDSPGLPSPSPVARAMALLGAGLRTRVVELVAPDGTDAAYRAEPYAELVVRAEARFFDVAFVRASFGTSLELRSEREDPRLGELESWFAWAQADAGASLVLDETVELGAAFGAGWDRYGLAFNELLPTAEYVHLRPALMLSVRLVGRALVLHAEGALRVPLALGDLASVYGVEHEAIGADGLVRLQGSVEPGFTWAIDFGVRRYWLRFTRAGGSVQGSDHGWSATAWAGWAF